MGIDGFESALPHGYGLPLMMVSIDTAVQVCFYLLPLSIHAVSVRNTLYPLTYSSVGKSDFNIFIYLVCKS